MLNWLWKYTNSCSCIKEGAIDYLAKPADADDVEKAY